MNDKGLNNDHELLKQADTDDTTGMVKYSIDLEPGEEKITQRTDTNHDEDLKV